MNTLPKILLLLHISAVWLLLVFFDGGYKIASRELRRAVYPAPVMVVDDAVKLYDDFKVDILED